jgi:hypothetical protein
MERRAAQHRSLLALSCENAAPSGAPSRRSGGRRLAPPADPEPRLRAQGNVPCTVTAGSQRTARSGRRAGFRSPPSTRLTSSRVRRVAASRSTPTTPRESAPCRAGVTSLLFLDWGGNLALAQTRKPFVMAGLVPAIYVLTRLAAENVDHRVSTRRSALRAGRAGPAMTGA